MPLLKAAKGVAMCCRKAGVVGLVGAVLVFLGLVHLVAGVYFMLALPMFQLGSNLWTGAWCGICGVILGTIGWKQQTLRKGQVILVASLSVLVVEVANLVIIQVGEYRVFLSENDRRVIVEDNQDLTMQIAFWLTTLVTAMGIVVSFFGAQYLFCVVVRGPRVKGHMPVTRSLSEEDLHHRQVYVTRFQTPSLSRGAGIDNSTLTVGSNSLGDESRHVHDPPGDVGVGSSSNVSHPKPLRVVINNEGGEERAGSIPEVPQPASSSTGTGAEGELSSQERDAAGSSKDQAPRTPENCVPYFLRNHKATWQFIIPEVVEEMRMSHRFSVADSFQDGHSRTSTLSKASKSSFHPHRPNPFGQDHRPDVIDINRQQQPAVFQEYEMARRGGTPSSCNTSLYSIPGSCGGRSGSKSPSGHRIVRPNVPPPAPPPTKSTAALRASSAGGWKPCAVLQYPAQGGGGFVVDLD